jgi:hypothetical protein
VNVPGSPFIASGDDWPARDIGRAGDLWGINPADVPAVALVSAPGDLVLFNHNLCHASFGGGSRRRMFTLNACRRAVGTEEVDELEGYINGHARFWIDHLHSDQMRGTGPASRRKHLEQVAAQEGSLAALSAEARRTMPGPARG